ncbi:TPA: terminase small subunit [Streptococcus suis]|nr:terminase small subunit [Streptococcus suis]
MRGAKIFHSKRPQKCGLFVFGGGDGKLNDLTIKQKKFADEYIISGNATEAYKKAGYRVSSDRVASVEGHKLLRNPKIKTYIDERLKILESEKIATQEEVLTYLTSVMRGQTQEQILCSVGELGQQVIDIEVGAKDRIKAAELLGKRHRLWTDKVEAEVNGTVVFANEADIPD